MTLPGSGCLLAGVTVLSPPYSELTYAWPKELDRPAIGLRVIIPLGRSRRVGVVTSVQSAPPKDCVLKRVVWPLEYVPLLDENYMDMVRNLSARQMVPVGKVLEAVLPKGLRLVNVSFECLDRSLTVYSAKEMQALEGGRLADAAGLWLEQKIRVRPGKLEQAKDHFILAKDPPWPVRPNAKRQIEFLEFLYNKGPQGVSGVNAALGDWASQAGKKLVRAGLVEIGAAPMDAEPEAGTMSGEPGYELTPEQQAAFEDFFLALASPEPETRLLHGVTGSGKTEVYLRLAGECLGLGKSAMLLAPEVALAVKLYKACVERFGPGNIVFHHGYHSQAKKTVNFKRVADGPCVVVGTRSALFMPVKNLGLAVLDEEHDESFKQEDRLPYQAKEVAYYRILKSAGLLVLGSATPDIRTYQSVRNHVVLCQEMPSRISGALLPEVEVVPIPKHMNPDTPFAEKSAEMLKEVVARGEQAVIMLNRRGYAPVMYCQECETVLKCPNCDISLTFHKGREKLVCHYCGQSISFPVLCPNCKTSAFLPMGGGTEKLEERIRRILPKGTGVLRMDRDTTSRQENLGRILDDFAAGKAQVLVGTQMLSKGHHFPDVTLVIVQDADMGMSIPDYRAQERTFQLLVQVSGRAGRGEKPGKVLIQTRKPELKFWDFVRSGDYKAFFDQEIGLREKYNYPPFVKLALIKLSYPVDWADGPERMGDMAGIIREKAMAMGLFVLGPTSAPISFLHGRKRFNCLVKADDWHKVRKLYALALKSNKGDKLRIKLDLEPVSML